MKLVLTVGALLIAVAAILAVAGCDKEKVVQSTEYVREYVQLPPDTVLQIDTVTVSESDTVYAVDTVVQTHYVVDTVQVHDTVTTVEQHFDTVTVIDTTFIVDTVETVENHYYYDTVTVVDTIVTVQNHYDTVNVVDTVYASQCTPNEYLAFAALQYYSDPMVIDAINSEFGVNDGWVFYLSAYQHEVTRQSADTYDIYGLIDYWTPDWSGFYAFEFYWRMHYVGGDPADHSNWEIFEPPGAAPGFEPGLNLSQDRTPIQAIDR